MKKQNEIRKMVHYLQWLVGNRLQFASQLQMFNPVAEKMGVRGGEKGLFFVVQASDGVIKKPSE